MKLTLTTVLICTLISTLKVAATESDGTPDLQGESFAAAIGHIEPENLPQNTDSSKRSSTGTSAGETCDLEKIQRGWTLGVSKFKRQLKNLESLFRISFEDLIVHLENGTVEDSWVGQLGEDAKHLKAIHKEHSEGKEQPEQVKSTLSGKADSAGSLTGGPMGEACDLKKIQRGWTIQVTNFQSQFESLQSVIKISVVDLLQHMEDGTVEDSFAEQLVEHGKHLKVTHKDYSEESDLHRK